MTEKQKIKQSEARILVYLSIVHPTRRHVTAIANKLEIDYSYVMRILQAMTSKGWLTKHQYRRHMFYSLTEFAPLEGAKNAYNTGSLQQSLLDTATTEETTEKVPQLE
jgi:DNA-binding MarR family transcriptional regulator